MTRLKPPEGGVTIRMYRQGLGDAFLLAFDGPQPDEPRYVLIDCGVHGAQKGGRSTLESAVSNILEATDRHLHVVIGTHEHTDHLSGFVAQAARFLGEADDSDDGPVTIDQLWLAWTEKPGDRLAKKLRRGRAAAARAVRKALKKLKEEARGDDRRRLAATGLQGYEGFTDADVDIASLPARVRALPAAGRADKVTGNELALALLRDLADEVCYFKPGQIAEIDGVAHARAYVLGPPRDEKLIKKSDPSRGTRSEVYFTADVGMQSFMAAVNAASDDSRDADSDEVLEELAHPFDKRHWRTEEWGRKQEFFKNTYHHTQSAWRKIDHDWLFTAETLALHLDSDTNNTSLALAFEVGRPGDGAVLVFPGDAQVGNWLSWKGLEWQVGQRTVEVVDLLRRTAVYKVSHHASHNGTVKKDADDEPFGLELMPDGMVALIPVDNAAASKLRGWDMPYDALYDVLKEKTSKNILRSDDLDRSIGRPTTRARRAPGLRRVRWRRSKEKKSDGGSLYYDIELLADD